MSDEWENYNYPFSWFDMSRAASFSTYVECVRILTIRSEWFSRAVGIDIVALGLRLVIYPM
jgi:hypothetical protein